MSIHSDNKFDKLLKKKNSLPSSFEIITKEKLLDELQEKLIECAEESAALDMKMQEIRGKIEENI